MGSDIAAGRTGATTGTGNTCHVEVKEQCFAKIAGRKRNVEYGVKAVTKSIAVEFHARHLLFQFFRHITFQVLNILLVCRHVVVCNFHGLGQPDNAIHIFCATAHITFLGAAVNQRVDADVAVDIEESYTLGTVEFMGCTGEKMNRHFLYIERIMTHRLDRISVKDGIVFLTEFGDLF